MSIQPTMWGEHFQETLLKEKAPPKKSPTLFYISRHASGMALGVARDPDGKYLGNDCVPVFTVTLTMKPTDFDDPLTFHCNNSNQNGDRLLLCDSDILRTTNLQQNHMEKCYSLTF